MSHLLFLLLVLLGLGLFHQLDDLLLLLDLNLLDLLGLFLLYLGDSLRDDRFRDLFDLLADRIRDGDDLFLNSLGLFLLRLLDERLGLLCTLHDGGGDVVDLLGDLGGEFFIEGGGSLQELRFELLRRAEGAKRRVCVSESDVSV